MLLTDTINDMMKGYYVLVPEPEQVLVYDVHTKGLAWKWDLTQMQGFQHRRVASEVEITVGRLCVFVCVCVCMCVCVYTCPRLLVCVFPSVCKRHIWYGTFWLLP